MSKKNVLWTAVGIIGGLIVVCCVGGILALNTGDKGKPSPTASRTYADLAPAIDPSASANALPSSASFPPVESPSPTPQVWGDGTWIVGEDIPAGTYKVTAPVGSRCYWEITASGTNGAKILANDIPGGGYPKVTLKKGQDFSSSDCGDWKRVK